MRKRVGILCSAVALASLTATMSCKKDKPTSSVKGADCAFGWLGAFLDAIPLPGFSLLGKATKITATAATSALKSTGVAEVKGQCGGPAAFSSLQMDQMKGAVKEGFDNQNHLQAKILMNNLDSRFGDFIPDKDKFNQFTMNTLASILEDTTKWWSAYDESGVRLYNVNDFVIVTALAMKAYQHQIREVALAAAENKNASAAQLVRDYSELLSKKADHARKELDEISNADIVGVAKSFWENNGDTQSKTSWNHCYKSNGGGAYTEEDAPGRDQYFYDRIGGTKTLAELKDFVTNHGTVCCMDGTCSANSPAAIEPRIKKYIEVTIPHVKRVVFLENAGIMKYFNETLPLFITAANNIKAAPDDVIFALASGDAPADNGGESTPGGDGSVSGGGSNGGCPDGDNGAGKGFGTIYACGSNQCAKSDKGCTQECIIGGGSSDSGSSVETVSGGDSGGGCPDGDNGAGKGFGTIYACGSNQCAKSDKSYAKECIIGGGSSSTGSSTGGSGGGSCPDGDNGTGKGFGAIYACGNNKCAKSDKSYATECIIGGSSSSGSSSSDGTCPDGDNGAGKGYGAIYQCGNDKCAKDSNNWNNNKQCKVKS